MGKLSGTEHQFKEVSELQDYLNANDIPCWIEYGTLLGCIRESGVISWDTDIDLGVMIPNPEFLIRHIANFYGYEESKWTDTRPNVGRTNINIMADDIRIDNKNLYIQHDPQLTHTASGRLHGMHLDHDNKLYLHHTTGLPPGKLKEIPVVDLYQMCEYEDFLLNPQVAHYFREYSNVFPLKQIYMKGNTFWIPNNPIRCLELSYGDGVNNEYGANWQVPVKTKSSTDFAGKSDRIRLSIIKNSPKHKEMWDYMVKNWKYVSSFMKHRGFDPPGYK